MTQLISLFRDVADDQRLQRGLAEFDERAPALNEEPEYFTELLAYLRSRNTPAEIGRQNQHDMLCGS